MDILTDGTITLSAPTMEDVGAITAACQDPAISEFTTVPYPYTLDHARGFVRTIAPKSWANGGATFAIRDGGHVAGMIGLDGPPGDVKEIGYWLSPEFRGRGVLDRAVPLVLDYGFDELALRKITWAAVVGNWASWRAVWKQGFQREGTRRAAHSDSRGAEASFRDSWGASLLVTDPRNPAGPWDGPVGNTPALGNPRDPEELVRQFHATYGLPIVTGDPTVDRDRIGMRMALIAEEFAELVGAVYGSQGRGIVERAYAQAVASDDHTRDTVEAADALADMIYVIYGMALETGIPLDAVLREVQRSNLSKLGADGRPILREDGKILKGPGFSPPDIGTVLAGTRLTP